MSLNNDGRSAAQNEMMNRGVQGCAGVCRGVSYQSIMIVKDDHSRRDVEDIGLLHD